MLEVAVSDGEALGGDFAGEAEPDASVVAESFFDLLRMEISVEVGRKVIGGF